MPRFTTFGALGALCIVALTGEPSRAQAQNYYAQQNIEREHDAYIKRQTEINTRYYSNSGSAQATFSPADFSGLFPTEEPAYVKTQNAKEKWEQTKWDSEHRMEAYIRDHPESVQSSATPTHKPTPEEFVTYNKAASDKGDMNARTNYARALYLGYGVPVNKVEAYRLLREASAFNVEAEAGAASMLFSGDGVPANPAEGMALMQHAAEAGSALAAEWLDAVKGSYSADVIEARAVKGDFRPMTSAGISLLRGSFGRTKDLPKALDYLQRAATAGDTDAQAFLGEMYEDGEGTPVNLAEALKWYLKADAAHSSRGRYYLIEYYRAHGGKTDSEILDMAKAQVASDPSASAYAQLAAIQFHEKDLVSARTNFAKGAELGDRQALSMVGVFEWRGMGGPVDAKNGFAHLLAASDLGEITASVELGDAYADGENGLTADAAKAFSYYMRAAEQGDPGAETRVSMAYFQGEGVAQSYDNAFVWASKAAAQDDKQAQYVMAILTAAGIGGPKNPPLAVIWMKKAAENGHVEAKKAMAAGYAGT